MSLVFLIEQYGYWAILAGTFLEGEMILILGGFAAQRGYLHLPWVILVAFLGSLMGDQLYFFLGRYQSERILTWHPLWEERIRRFQRLLEGFTTVLTLTFRFLYGLRTVAPFVIGMSKISTGKFIILNITGAIIWAIMLGLGGYFFGNALEQLIGDIKHYEFLIFGIIAVAGILIWTVHFYHTRRKKARSEKPF